MYCPLSTVLLLFMIWSKVSWGRDRWNYDKISNVHHTWSEQWYYLFVWSISFVVLVRLHDDFTNNMNLLLLYVHCYSLSRGQLDDHLVSACQNILYLISHDFKQALSISVFGSLLSMLNIKPQRNTTCDFWI